MGLPPEPEPIPRTALRLRFATGVMIHQGDLDTGRGIITLCGRYDGPLRTDQQGGHLPNLPAFAGATGKPLDLNHHTAVGEPSAACGRLVPGILPLSLGNN